MLMTAEQSLLLLIDMQDKLVAAVDQPQQLVANCQWLLKLSQLLKVPIAATEQYAKGIGPTVAALQPYLEQVTVVDKTVFSCLASADFSQHYPLAQYQQFVLCGIEAHACILQTALQLLAQNKQVFVVVDSISARQPQDTHYALQRMQQQGAVLVTKEMVGFEWLRDAKHPAFKTFSQEFLR
ncbi:isochorismatase family protein [Thiopseudomonas alkaliphila]|uniref:Isochorismatase n=1 Tax=Thiopseudomonas alkaliphila TaxID=1697053 RepID=A0A0K1XET7_9GAMM|nr:isochorismatase family protein [Thiopseudomonas alkaliphila]AKX59856.1 isochorismatase [Thiopseudomonas alkaliphila]MDM1715938.1 isochorismatase family protein [Thiopseudomonas alkaliphila]